MEPFFQRNEEEKTIKFSSSGFIFDEKTIISASSVLHDYKNVCKISIYHQNKEYVYDKKTQPKPIFCKSPYEMEQKKYYIFKLPVPKLLCVPEERDVYFVLLDEPQVSVGDSIFIMSSPYGLLNPFKLCDLLSKGIISKQFEIKRGDDEPTTAFLMDISTLPGADGAIVFRNTSLKDTPSVASIVGVCCGCTRESKFAYSLSIVDVLKDLRITTQSLEQPKPTPNVIWIDKVKRKVVKIKGKNGWATGVVISTKNKKCFVLSSQHSIRSLEVEKLFLNFYGGGKCEVVDYVIHSKFHDVSIICCSVASLDGRDCFAELDFSGEYNVGDSVWFFGFPLDFCDHEPLVQKGIISKLVCPSNEPKNVLEIVTSLKIYSGSSGGLLTNKNGKIIGICKGNLKRGDGSEISFINFSIPIKSLGSLKYVLEEPVHLDKLKLTF